MKESNKYTQNDIKGALLEFISENFIISSVLDSFADKDSFMEKGITDSTGVLELLEFIEEKMRNL